MSPAQAAAVVRSHSTVAFLFAYVRSMRLYYAFVTGTAGRMTLSSAAGNRSNELGRPVLAKPTRTTTMGTIHLRARLDLGSFHALCGL